HYFVDNPEVDKWEDGIIADLVNIYSGYAFKRTDFNPDGKYGLVTIKNVQDGNFLNECSDHLSIVPEKAPDYVYLNTGDILLSLTGNVGRVCIVHGNDLLLNQRVSKLVGVDGRYSFAYFMFRQNEFKDKLISMSRGTAQLNLSPIETKKIKIKLPPADTLENFYSEAESLFESIAENNKQIQTLTTLRDTLLPRLISGKMTV
ncbi:MAG: restriction endonuclease subunit S, partial [Candidatus Saccharimonadales bacterium]